MKHVIGLDPDINSEEMAKSESKSKFCWASATRATFLLNLEARSQIRKQHEFSFSLSDYEEIIFDLHLDLDEPKSKRRRRNSI